MRRLRALLSAMTVADLRLAWRRVARLDMVGAAILGIMCPSGASAQALGQYVYGQFLDSEIPITTVTGRNQGVRDRTKPELKPVGVSFGGFRLFPAVDGGLGYSSNVVGAETNTRSDGYVEVRPSASIQSQWARNSLNVNLIYDGIRFFRTPAEKQNGFVAEVDGRLDFLNQDYLYGTASFRRSYEDQLEASFPQGGAGAVAVDQPAMLVRGSYSFNRVRLTASADYNGFTYRDTISTTGSVLQLSYRNRDVYRGSARGEYMLGQDNSVFVQATFRRTDYRTDNWLDDRTSNEWRVSAGAIADVTELLRIAGGVGYFHRTYPNPLFRSFAGAAVDLRASYYLTPLVTVTGIASRQPEEASIFGSSGYVQTRIGARIDYEILRNVIAYLTADYSHASFRGIDRRDQATDGGGGIDWFVNRLVSAGVAGSYVSRVSHGADRGADIPEFRGLFSVRYHP